MRETDDITERFKEYCMEIITTDLARALNDDKDIGIARSRKDGRLILTVVISPPALREKTNEELL